jgi:hypothetical protein
MSNEEHFKKLRGKYFNKTITPQELKRFMELAMTRNNHVSMNEIASMIRANANK